MAFFGLDGVVAAVFFVLLSLISLLLRFSVLDAPDGFIHVGRQASIMLAMFKDFALLVLCLCMFTAEVPLMPTLMQHGPLFKIYELVF
ncbi:hypothetical protein D5086_030066 [Populus alba]|uniref:Uncharacterized protein n=1 Tax=Populus alba TaxID=43335 RepID=A0ACC4AMH1_POPAL